jgi:4-hydroxy-2-oxoglutarate aldolase
MNLLPEGILPPVPTTFRHGEFHAPDLAANLERWNRTPLAGYVVLGSNGEGVHLADDEALAVIETAASGRGRDKLLVAGTGRESTSAAVDFTRRAAHAGAQAALVFCPAYYRSAMTDSALEHHYRVLADAAEIPIILYHVPKFRPVTFSIDLVLRLAEHPNILGIKDTSGDLAFMAALLKDRPPGFRIYVGMASILLAGLALGADGGILALANVAPVECVALAQAVQRCDLAQARSLQFRLLPVNQAVTSRFGIPGLKHALDLLGYHGGEARRPLEPLAADAKDTIAVILENAGLLTRRERPKGQPL